MLKLRGPRILYAIFKFLPSLSLLNRIHQRRQKLEGSRNNARDSDRYFTFERRALPSNHRTESDPPRSLRSLPDSTSLLAEGRNCDLPSVLVGSHRNPNLDRILRQLFKFDSLKSDYIYRTFLCYRCNCRHSFFFGFEAVYINPSGTSVF